MKEQLFKWCVDRILFHISHMILTYKNQFYFQSLARDEVFQSTLLSDQIALLAIYMSIICAEIVFFV